MTTKKIHANSVIGQQGINLIEGIVLRMGYLWHPSGQVEAGIDGIIEIRDVVTSTATNCIIQVQSKATSRQFVAETDATLEYLCEARDLAYWLAGNAPVVLIVSRPSTDEAYWVVVKEYFADLARLKERRIIFSKTRDRFDVSCQQALFNLARPRDSGIYLAPPPRKERLYSNLLAVAGYANRLFVAETEYRERRDLWEALKVRGIEHGGEWLLKNDRIYTFHDLSLAPWTTLCERGTVEDIATCEWADSSDQARRRDFVDLLNRCLTEKGRGLGLSYHPRLDFYYFSATPDLAQRVVSYQSMTNRASRTVFQAYPNRRDPSRTAYFRHSAFTGKFQRYGGSWYLEITPTYHFTWDGYHVDRHYEDRLKRIKMMERNPAVLGQVLMWSDYFSQPADLFTVEYPFLQFGSLQLLDVEAGLDDKSWLGEEEGEEASVLASPLNEGLWAEE